MLGHILQLKSVIIIYCLHTFAVVTDLFHCYGHIKARTARVIFKILSCHKQRKCKFSQIIVRSPKIHIFLHFLYPE